MKKYLLLVLLVLLSLFSSEIFSQNKSTYKVGETNYVYGETYKTTGNPKVQRNSSTRQEFLKSKGYSKVPTGYQVDHIVPLSQGGKDTPSNMQLITKEQHRQKTANERKTTSAKSVSNTIYKTPSSYNTTKVKSTNSYKSSHGKKR